MEISGGALVSFPKKWRNGEILIIFRAFAFTHSFALHTCKLGQRKRKCKRKVKTAWTRGRLLRWHLRRTCEPGLYNFWESILQSQILTIKSCMMKLQLYAYLSEDFFSDLSQHLVTKLSQRTVSTSCVKRLFVWSRSSLLTFSRRIGSLCSDFRLTRDVGCILEKRNLQHRRLYLTDRVDAMVTVWLTWPKKIQNTKKVFDSAGRVLSETAGCKNTLRKYIVLTTVHTVFWSGIVIG